MADSRFFAKIDVGYFDNPKIAAFIEDRPAVMILHLRAILYCRQHLTDGVFPHRLIARLSCASHCGGGCESQCEPHSGGRCDFCAACDAGLFERVDETTAAVHDYLLHQESREQVKARKNAGIAGAEGRWGKKGQGKSDANRNAEGIAGRNAESNANRNAEERRGEERKLGVAEAPPREDVTRLCTYLADKIEANGSKRPAITKRWQDSARLLIDKDGQTEAEVLRIIDWSQADDFWQANILSMPKLREKFDQLRLRANSERPKDPVDPNAQWNNPWAN